jgi:hypothetical protein
MNATATRSERPAQVRSVRGCVPGVHVRAGYATPAPITAQQRKESAERKMVVKSGVVASQRHCRSQKISCEQAL